MFIASVLSVTGCTKSQNFLKLFFRLIYVGVFLLYVCLNIVHV